MQADLPYYYEIANVETASYPTASSLAGLDLDQVFEVPQRSRILIVDDDPDTILLLKKVLQSSGYDVLGAANGSQAITKCQTGHPDVILLDLMMPGMDGWVTYTALRQITEVPIVFLSAVADKETVIRGLKMGANDYITKPFHREELAARLKNILHCAAGRQQIAQFSFPKIGLKVDPANREARLMDRVIHLTPREFALLTVLSQHASQFVRYEEIARQVWGEDTPEVRQSIKYLIYLLRHKLGETPGEPKFILNSEKLGYKLQTGDINV